MAPFSSDEGSDTYYEWRRWRNDNRSRPVTECLSWILGGNLDGYNESLHSNEQIERDLANPDSAFLAGPYDMFTLDTTIIASVLGQLMDEGTIDAETKPYARVAINRQLHPCIFATAKSAAKYSQPTNGLSMLPEQSAVPRLQ